VHNLCLTLTPEIIMKPNELPLIEDLATSFNYDPLTGKLYWKTETRNQRKVGDEAGYRSPTGYIYVKLNGKRYLAHRICMALIMGRSDLGDLSVDHVNGDRTDNRESNLRLVTHSENITNVPRKKNTSLHRGITIARGGRRVREKFRASITIKGRAIHLGYFDTLEEAIAARMQAEHEHNIFVRM
jgi:hypothetical protein